MTAFSRSLSRSLVLVLALAACGKKGGGDKLGVPECDAYLDKMAACAAKVGGKTGDQLTKMRNMMAEAWKADLKEPSLPKVCTGAIDDMRKQAPQCDW